MKSIWIVLGRDSEFGKSHVVEHLYVFESSFDAYAFVHRTRDYDHLPEIARTISWEVQEHPINENKVQPLTDFSNIYRIADIIEQAEESKDD
jgi:hypothetical protein